MTAFLRNSITLILLWHHDRSDNISVELNYGIYIICMYVGVQIICLEGYCCSSSAFTEELKSIPHFA